MQVGNIANPSSLIYTMEVAPAADGRIEIYVPPDICEDANEILNIA